MQYIDVVRLILEAATGVRQLIEDEIRQIIEYLAQAEFDPAMNVRAVGLAGMTWQGRTLRGTDLITSAERHYLRHVIKQQEWPIGTQLEDYISSIRAVIRDEKSGLFTSRYMGRWQLGIVRRSRELRGPGGTDWVLIEYRLDIGYWVTAFHLRGGLAELYSSQRENIIWLRQPQP